APRSQPQQRPPQQRATPPAANGAARQQPVKNNQNATAVKEIPKVRNDKEAHGQTADSTHNAVSSEHRDRRSGRHGGLFGDKTENKPQQVTKPSGQRNQHNQKNNQRQQATAVMPPRRPLKKDTHRVYKGNEKATDSGAGITTKVKSFFSKLFK
ncbi:MAG: hypothetical protein SGI74_09720, partial [Oligoflexia bacterium]|nr:hypothetical protein [Oligoflexia bacterium]